MKNSGLLLITLGTLAIAASGQELTEAQSGSAVALGDILDRLSVAYLADGTHVFALKEEDQQHRIRSYIVGESVPGQLNFIAGPFIEESNVIRFDQIRAPLGDLRVRSYGENLRTGDLETRYLEGPFYEGSDWEGYVQFVQVGEGIVVVKRPDLKPEEGPPPFGEMCPYCQGPDSPPPTPNPDGFPPTSTPGTPVVEPAFALLCCCGDADPPSLVDPEFCQGDCLGTQECSYIVLDADL